MAIINQIVKGGGSTPTGTKQITTNGTHDVAAYEYADVQVPTTAPEIYRVFRVNNGKIENSISTPFLPLPSTATDIGDYCMYRAYNGTPSSVLSGTVDLSNLTTITGNHACYYMFGSCIGITSVNLSNLTTISGDNACNSMFSNCSGITSVNLSNLTTINGPSALAYMFYANTSLVTATFAMLKTIRSTNCFNSTFNGCTSLTSISFPALTSSSFNPYINQFNNMLLGVTGCTIHFPSNLDPQSGSTVISSLTGYPNFGGINTVLAFDLPATES